MKKMRRLIPAFAMLLVAATMLSTASFAWFTMGETAKAEGMQVTATAASSLLIATTADVSNFESATSTVKFTDGAASLKPATVADSSVTSTTGLMTVTDASKVTHATGAYTGTYAAVAESAEGEYYVDYTFYLFTAGSAATGKELEITVTPAEFTESVHNAVTIAFWVSTKKGTDVTYSSKSINFLTASQEGKNVVNLGKIDIPVGMNADLTAVADYVTVTMRVYYDGALPEGTTGKYYVRNNQIPSKNAGFTVDIALVGGTTEGGEG